MKKQAFTLIELLITISIAGILLVIGIPALHGFVIQNKAAAETNNIVSALQFARSEAIKKNVNIEFCKKDHWRSGQVIVTTHGKILRVFPALPVGDELMWDSSLGENDCLEFSALGFTNGQRGTFYYYPQGEKKDVKRIIINAAGRIRVED